MKNIDGKNTGQYIKELRLRKGLKQRDVAERAGISPTLVSSIELGTRRLVNPEQVDRIAIALEMTEKERSVLDKLVAKETKELPQYVQAYINRTKACRDAVTVAAEKNISNEIWNDILHRLDG